MSIKTNTFKLKSADGRILKVGQKVYSGHAEFKVHSFTTTIFDRDVSLKFANDKLNRFNIEYKANTLYSNKNNALKAYIEKAMKDAKARIDLALVILENNIEGALDAIK